MTTSGIVFVDKPAGFTSHDVVAKLRRMLGTRKVGHAGTLDPMATGLLTIGVGSSTRLLTHMVGLSKTYTATIRLGIATVSDDREGHVTSIADPIALNAVTDDDITRVVRSLTGEIDQVPSSVSAKKVDGKRAYALVREGKEVELKARRVTIHSFEVHQIVRHQIPRHQIPEQQVTQDQSDGQIAVIDVQVTVDCSSGTYIRALARDLATGLGNVGGHLIALRRIAVGPFSVEPENIEPEDVESENNDNNVFRVMGQDQLTASQALRDASLSENGSHENGSHENVSHENAPRESEPPDNVSKFQDATSFTVAPEAVARKLFEAIELDELQATHLRQGKRFEVQTADTELSAAFDPSGKLIGLVQVKQSEIKVITNFPVDEEA